MIGRPSEAEEAVPAAQLPVSVRAPAKCILFGEHAVVHGQPELLLAIDLYTLLVAQGSTRLSLNGEEDPGRTNPYLRRALESGSPPPPLALTTTSRIPRGAGLGSSAAFVAALETARAALEGGLSRPALAQRAFDLERGAQGVGSPGDTSAVVAGGLLTVNAGAGPELWAVTDGTQRWVVRRVPDPAWSWLVAYSGVPRDTARTVRAVSSRLAAPDGPRLLERFRAVAEAGVDALRSENRSEVGRLLGQNQELLREVGASHPRLEALLEAVAPSCEGAKLTGAGAGGSIVALPLPGRELETIRRVTRAGGSAYAVRVAPRGVHLVDRPASMVGIPSEGPPPGA